MYVPRQDGKIRDTVIKCWLELTYRAMKLYEQV